LVDRISEFGEGFPWVELEKWESDKRQLSHSNMRKAELTLLRRASSFSMRSSSFWMYLEIGSWLKLSWNGERVSLLLLTIE